jgi:hypothetical protein
MAVEFHKTDDNSVHPQQEQTQGGGEPRTTIIHSVMTTDGKVTVSTTVTTPTTVMVSTTEITGTITETRQISHRRRNVREMETLYPEISALI